MVLLDSKEYDLVNETTRRTLNSNQPNLVEINSQPVNASPKMNDNGTEIRTNSLAGFVESSAKVLSNILSVSINLTPDQYSLMLDQEVDKIVSYLFARPEILSRRCSGYDRFDQTFL